MSPSSSTWFRGLLGVCMLARTAQAVLLSNLLSWAPLFMDGAAGVDNQGRLRHYEFVEDDGPEVPAQESKKRKKADKKDKKDKEKDKKKDKKKKKKKKEEKKVCRAINSPRAHPYVMGPGCAEQATKGSEREQQS